MMKRNEKKTGKSSLGYLVLALLTVSIFTAANTPEPQGESAYIDIEYFSKLVFDEVNKTRAANGKRKLKWDDICSEAAKEQARYCASLGKLTHTQDNPEMQNVKKRYRHYKGTAGLVGENLLTLQFTIPNHQAGDSLTERITRRYKSAAKFMVKLWMESPAHKKNLLYDEYKVAGVNMVYTKRREVYVGQVFAGN